MITGIDPRVDIAFKKIFGTPAWSELTMSLIDAVLCPLPGQRVVQLDLLNPYSEQDSLSDKLTVLDIKARDERGRWFNVEMQMHLGRALTPRLLYYWARLYGGQLVEGNDYDQLRPTISICFVNQVMFREREAYHSIFRLVEHDSQIRLTDHQEFHLLEIPKFQSDLETLREPLDFWLYFLQNGKGLDADSLPGPLARPDICQAMEVLKVFSQNELERDRYENRLKAQRDFQALKWERDETVRERDEAVRTRDEAVRTRDEAVRARDEAARERDEAVRDRDEAIRARDAIVREREEAIQQRDSARQEWARVRQQELANRILLCQKLLGQSPTPCETLLAESLDNLQLLVEKLERQLLGLA